MVMKVQWSCRNCIWADQTVGIKGDREEENIQLGRFGRGERTNKSGK